MQRAMFPLLPAVLFLATLFGVLPVNALAQSAEEIKILVVVNGVPVTNVDIEESLRQRLDAINAHLEEEGRPTMTLSQLRSQKEIMDRILEQHIEEIILQQEIERYELTVSEEELDARIQALGEQQGLSMAEMAEVLEQEGRSMQEFREDLRRDLLKHQLIRGKVGKKIVITENEIMEVYKERATVGSGEVVHLAMILLPPGEDPAPVLERIRDGDMTFAEAADEYSVGPGVGEGGDLGFLDVVELAQDWRDAIEGLEAGQVSEPFDMDGRTAIIQLKQRKQGEVVVDQALKEQIYEELREKKFQETLDEYLETVRTQSLIQYKNEL